MMEIALVIIILTQGAQYITLGTQETIDEGGFNALHPKGKAVKNRVNPLQNRYKADTIP
jgi:hypothetical protein